MLPNDTRATELTCSSILLISLLLISFGHADHALIENVYTSLFLCLVPVMHLAGIIVDEYKKLRVYGALCTGALMVYLGFLNLGDVALVTCLSTIVLGFSNMYAFLINNQRLK